MENCKVIAITNQKGGVGKTTTTVNLGVGLANTGNKVLMAIYLLFEEVAINYRPVLIDGNLEASYPSSTTMLALCVLPTAMMQLKSRIRHIAVRRAVLVTLGALTAFMVVGRLISGVHWLTDIIGGVLLSVGLVMLYAFAIKRQGKSRDNSPGTV